MSTLLNEEQELALYDALNAHYDGAIADAAKMLYNNTEHWIFKHEILVLEGPALAVGVLARATAAVAAILYHASAHEPEQDVQAASDFSMRVYSEMNGQLKAIRERMK